MLSTETLVLLTTIISWILSQMYDNKKQFMHSWGCCGNFTFIFVFCRCLFQKIPHNQCLQRHLLQVQQCHGQTPPPLRQRPCPQPPLPGLIRLPTPALPGHDLPEAELLLRPRGCFHRGAEASGLLHRSFVLLRVTEEIRLHPARPTPPSTPVQEWQPPGSIHLLLVLEI